MDVLNAIWAGVASEFSDIPDLAEASRILTRMIVAALLGGLLGYERQRRGKAAGVRTHMMVSLGSAIFILVPQQAGLSGQELTRVVQGLISGVGFLGAGAIILGNQQSEARGVTTAATIWLTAAVGMAAGMGREATALLTTGLALGILAIVPKFVHRLDVRRRVSGERAAESDRTG